MSSTVSAIVTRRRAGDRFSQFRSTPEEPPLPLQIQERALRAERVHAVRAIIRGATLLAGDVAMLALGRLGFHAVAGTAGDSGTLAAMVTSMIPRGALSPARVCVAVILGLVVCGNYGAADRRRDPSRLLAGVVLGLTVTWWDLAWTTFGVHALLGYAATVVGVFSVVVVGRYLMDLLVRAVCRWRGWGPRVLIVGTGHSARMALQLPMLSVNSEMRPIGYLDISPEPAADSLGSVDGFVRAITEHEIDTVIICDQIEGDTARSLVDIADSARCQVFTLPAYFNTPGMEPDVVWRQGNALVRITRPGSAGQQRAIKRAFDVIVTGIALSLLAPVFAVIAIAVRVSSPGPVFFKQARVGQGGRTFNIYKFRSMVRDAETRRSELVAASIYPDERLFKIRNDPRVTPLGAFLRRMSLDELPQLWNVFRGDMSLVGPRPPVPSEVVLYAEHHYTRFDVRPGLTGPWQVGGRNNITDFEEVIRLETAYIHHWTIWKDLRILLRTVPAVLRMDGAH